MGKHVAGVRRRKRCCGCQARENVKPGNMEKCPVRENLFLVSKSKYSCANKVEIGYENVQHDMFL